MALISKKELEEMYWGESGTEMGAPTIAKIIGCGSTTIYRYLDRYDIQKRKNENGESQTEITRKIIKEFQKNRERKEKEKNKMSKTRLKKKLSKGENNPAAKVRKEIALEIYKEYNNNKKITNKDLSLKYEISETTISEITSARHWATEHLKKG